MQATCQRLDPVSMAAAVICLLQVSLVDPSRAEAPSGNAKPAPTCELADGEDRTVIRVTDGETLTLDGGNEVKLIGALAPRAFDAAGEAAAWPLAERAREALDEIVAARSVRLAFAGRRTDRYGRLLAHVFVKRGDAQVWAQGEILKRGYARAYALEGSVSCLAELIAHEAVAREQAQGLWSDSAYTVRGAEDVATLLRLAGTYQIVEGKVVDVAELRGLTYINFGEDRRQDFTVVMRSSARRLMGEGAWQAEELKGQRIRVRGWIERRGGPLIDVPHPAAIEVLGPEAEPSAPQAPSRRKARRTTRAE